MNYGQRCLCVTRPKRREAERVDDDVPLFGQEAEEEVGEGGGEAGRMDLETGPLFGFARRTIWLMCQ